jgi:hypothetical protein
MIQNKHSYRALNFQKFNLTLVDIPSISLTKQDVSTNIVQIRTPKYEVNTHSRFYHYFYPLRWIRIKQDEPYLQISTSP